MNKLQGSIEEGETPATVLYYLSMLRLQHVLNKGCYGLVKSQLHGSGSLQS